MRKRISGKLLITVVLRIVLLICLLSLMSGCSLIGLTAGDIIDQNHPYMVPVQQFATLVPRMVVMVVTVDGEAFSGTISKVDFGNSITLKNLRSDNFDQRVNPDWSFTDEKTIQWEEIDRVYKIEHQIAAKVRTTRFTLLADFAMAGFLLLFHFAGRAVSALA